MGTSPLRLIELCEPFIYEVCNSIRLLSPARGASPVIVTAAGIRAQLQQAALVCARSATSAGRLLEWKAIEPALLCFADGMMVKARPAGDSFVMEWAGNRMADQPPHNINAGDSAFFESYLEPEIFLLLMNDPTFAPGTLPETRVAQAYVEAFGHQPSPADLSRYAGATGAVDASSLERLEVFYTCLQLGFQGKYEHDPRGPERLEKLRSVARRALYDRRIMAPANLGKLTPGAYHVLEGGLTLEAKPTAWASVVLVVVFAVSCFFFLGWCYKQATRSLETSVDHILKS